MNHPRGMLDDVIHSPVRFSVVAALAAVDRAEFRFVRDTVEVTDSALSKQVTVLENAGYVRVHKVAVGRRTRTSLSLSEEGRTAFEQHVRALRDIASGEAVRPPGDG
ncbi:winged helix-turn-helix domain-containing protein [Nocardiopsis quinghaiensis]|uniref:winged helix-turn-helix domain-containing protein n=1 Tax=Nocardiopsis quinghaiensis TaxID=464995 RepID=UPI00123BD4FE|nr:transcriptional regulator [Nocardiopsis quinghaiensis]